MPRITPVDPANATGRAKEIFDGPLKGKTFNIFRSMAQSPAALDAYLAISGALNHGTLSAKERETIQLVVGEANNCDYCVAAHTAIGKMSGLTEAQTVEARRGTLTDPKLDGLAKFVLALHEKRGFVSDGDIAAFKKAGYSENVIGEVVGAYALAIFTNYFNHANATVSDFPPVTKV
jgi:uncharacterized peroxidase-related enzyme